jgi:nitrogen fixation protein NifB
VNCELATGNGERSEPKHPCFDESARHTNSRIHLPVAPLCNVQCNFCNRKFDCINESRPGVTSSVVSPVQAMWYLDEMIKRDPSISVVGLAGPGDPFANPQETMQSLRRVRAAHPEMILCVASNGLGLKPYVKELAQLGVSHVTITVNAVDPEIAAQVYRWIRDGDEVLRGLDAGVRMLTRQAAVIRALKRHRITVKVNTICIPGVNDEHVLDIARAVKGLGADLFNLMSLKPVPGTAFAELPEPNSRQVKELRAACAEILPQMPHCSRCRADAVGRIGCANPDYAAPLLKEAKAMDDASIDTKPFVAVCSMEGMLVNQHLGHAEHLLIYQAGDEAFDLVDVRPAPPAGGGSERWTALVELLSDCRAVVASAAGPTPEAFFAEAGIGLYNTEGLIADALELIYAGRETELRAPSCSGPGGGCGGSCSGAGVACA